MNIRPLFAAIALSLAIPFSASAAVPLPSGGQKAEPRQRSRPAAESPERIAILSIIPAQGEPGITVTLSGTGFGDKCSVFLGSTEIPAQLLAQKQLSFEIPKLAPGLYALFVKNSDGSISKTYSFTITPVKPVADSLSPDTIQSCATGRDREVTISGSNFVDKSIVLFDGAVIRSRFLGTDSLSFTVPSVAPGLHQVQVKNPGDTASEVIGFTIDGRPEILGVRRGDEYVSSYNLIIEGRNFQQGSTLVVMEESTLEQMGVQPQIDVKRIRSGSSAAGERERVSFSSCSQLVYQRSPYSSTSKNLRLQVVNPNGEESAVVQATAP